MKNSTSVLATIQPGIKALLSRMQGPYETMDYPADDELACKIGNLYGCLAELESWDEKDNAA